MKYSKLNQLQLLNCFDLDWTNHLISHVSWPESSVFEQNFFIRLVF